MHFGLYLNQQYPPGTVPSDAVEGLLRQVALARDCGYDSVWVAHHYLGHNAMLQPIPLLARLAAEAGQMLLGTCVFLLPLEHPVSVAEQVATLDVITGGRLIFGVGLGYRPEEFAALGQPMRDRGSRAEEALALIERLWAGERVLECGSHYRVKDVQLTLLPRRQGGPPIWMGGTSPAAIRRAGRLGKVWIATPGMTAAEAARAFAIHRAELAAAGWPNHGPYPVMRELYCGEVTEAVRRAATRQLGMKYQAYSGSFPAVAGELGEPFIFGDEETCAAALARLSAGTGADTFILRMQWLGLDTEATLRSIERFAAGVMPRLRAGEHPTGNSGSHTGAVTDSDVPQQLG